MKKIFETYPTVPCKQLNESERQLSFDYMGSKNFYYQSLDTYGLCSKIPSKASVQGKATDEYSTFISFKIFPCSLPSGCIPLELIPQVNFQLLLPFSNIKVSDSNDPHDFAVDADDIYYVNPTIRQIYTAKLKELNIYDFEGILPSWILQKTVYDIESKTVTSTYRKPVFPCTPSQISVNDNQECLPLFEFNIQSSGVVSNTKRTYISLFDTLGAIGGTNGVIIVILLMIYGPINEKKRKEYMTRKIYSLIGVKEEDLEKGLDYISHRRKRTAINGGQTQGDPQANGDQGSQPESQRVIKIERRKWWTCFCFCCRKKTEVEIEWERKVAKAHARILDSLDVLSIVRNFNQLKVLTHFFFGERHFDLAQYVGFDLWQEECDKREKRGKEAEQEEAITKSELAEERRNLRRVRISKRILTEKQRFNNWMEFMRARHQEREDNEPNVQVITALGKELDEFYYQKLFDHQELHSNNRMMFLIHELMRIEAPDTVAPEGDEAEDRRQVNNEPDQPPKDAVPNRCESVALSRNYHSLQRAANIEQITYQLAGNPDASPTDHILALVSQPMRSTDEGINDVHTVMRR